LPLDFGASDVFIMLMILHAFDDLALNTVDNVIDDNKLNILAFNVA
jgi:hypothetical protein